MTVFRRHRSRDGRKPVPGGGYPDDGLSITEVIAAVRPEWDGATFGLPVPAPPVQDTQPLALLRAQPGYRPPAPAPDAGIPGGAYDAWGLDFGQEGGHAQSPAARQPPPALPPGPPAAAAGPRDTGPQQRLPRLSRTAARPRQVHGPGEMFIPVWVPTLGRHVLLCGMCRWRRHDDPAIACIPAGIFDALRDSARTAGWVLDSFGRWCCPACKDTPAYWSPRQLACYHPEVRRRKLAGQDVPASAEATAGAIIEHDLIRDVAAARHGRHAGGTR